MEREADRRHDLELIQKRLELDRDVSTLGSVNCESISRAKLRKLPPFQDGKDELDSYFQQFESFAKTDGSGWEAEQWAPALSALLTGKTLDVYSRLSDVAARDYSQLREALLRREDLTKDAYQLKFRRS